jgi:crotonobetainyl-CoA:carnitine CoA-transferase CaiB-like acyl-CoA transferase
LAGGLGYRRLAAADCAAPWGEACDDAEPAPIRRAPDFGEHTDEVLRELRYTDDIARYRKDGVAI